MQPTPDPWQPKPDQLLDQVMKRAQTLLAAESASLSQKVDSSRQAAMVAVITTQRQTIEDLTAACTTLHDRIDGHIIAGKAAMVRNEASSAELLRELDAARSALIERVAQIASLEHHLREMHASTSWRVTWPLRSLRRRLRAS